MTFDEFKNVVSVVSVERETCPHLLGFVSLTKTFDPSKENFQRLLENNQTLSMNITENV